MLSFIFLFDFQVEMSSKLLNMGEHEFQRKFQAANMNLKVFTVRIIKLWEWMMPFKERNK